MSIKFILNNINRYFHFYKYDILLIALIQHLFIGIFITDLDNYIHYIWPLNMIIIGIAFLGVFLEKENWKKWIRNILLILIIGFPLSLWAGLEPNRYFMLAMNLLYFPFFLFIFIEVLKFLILPLHINLDLIIAALCGYLLLIEILAFIYQFFYYQNPSSFEGVHCTNPADTYSSFVYFSSVTITSIGFGDIRPVLHNTKLLTAIFGILGQFYSVVLVGILIRKFNNRHI